MEDIYIYKKERKGKERQENEINEKEGTRKLVNTREY
jgi:hypothetical protein